MKFVVAVLIITLSRACCEGYMFSKSGLTPAMNTNAPMIAVRCNGRLGNQMFQYASAVGIAMRLHNRGRACIVCDNQTSLWEGFVEPPPFCSSKILVNVSIQFERGYARYHTFRRPSSSNLIVGRYLQSWRYLDIPGLRSQILQRYAFDDRVLREAEYTLSETRALKPSESAIVVAIHVRRTDKLQDEQTKHPSPAFYEWALGWFRTYFDGNVTFVVVSDDPSWCSTQYFFKSQDVFVPLINHSPVVHLATLSHADHRVISVGTFGWWAAWLSKSGYTLYNEEFSRDDVETQVAVPRDYYPPEWIAYPKTRSDTTIVTAYFQCNSKHSDAEYAVWMTNLLSIKDAMVIFTSSDMVSSIRKLRSHASDRTHIVEMKIRELWPAREFAESFWEEQLRIDPERSLHRSYELYWIWLSKSWFVDRATRLDPFDSRMYIWCDIGSMRDGRYRNRVLVRRDEIIPSSRLLLMASTFPYEPVDTSWIVKSTHGTYVAGAVMAGAIKTWQKFHAHFKTVVRGYKQRELFVGEDQAVIQTVCTRYLSMCKFVLPDLVSGDKWYGLQWALHHGISTYRLWTPTPPLNAVIWQIWLGREAPSRDVALALQSCDRLHRNTNLSVQIIGDDDLQSYLEPLHPAFYLLDRVEKSDYARIELLQRYGGFYLDADVVCARSLDHLSCTNLFRYTRSKCSVCVHRTQRDQ
eukprot:gene274-507_t